MRRVWGVGELHRGVVLGSRAPQHGAGGAWKVNMQSQIVGASDDRWRRAHRMVRGAASKVTGHHPLERREIAPPRAPTPQTQHALLPKVTELQAELVQHGGGE